MNNSADKWFIKFYLKIRSRLLKSACRLLPLHEAEEVVQDTMMRIYENRKHYAFKAIGPLAYRIVHNLAISRLRRKAVMVSNNPLLLIQQQINQANNDCETDLSASQEQGLLKEAVNSMPPICRQVFVYRKFYDLSHAEIAEIMQISKKTVENHLARGMRHCHNYIKTKDSNHSNVISVWDDSITGRQR